jgi:Predicted integral membrane protein (DUF2269)
MTFYSVLVFAHIASAFCLFAGLLLEAVVIGFLRRNPDLAPFRAWTRIFSLAPVLYGPALGVILLSGGYLGAQMSSWGQGWIRVSFFTLFVIGAIGGIFTSRRIKVIRRLIVEASDSTTVTLQNKLQDPVLLASVRIRIALVLGVLLLMVSKVALMPSLVIIAVSFAFGVVAALPAWKKGGQTRTAI